MIYRSIRSNPHADRRRLMMLASSAVLVPWFSGCGGGAGDEEAGDTSDPPSELEFPTVGPSPTGLASDTKHALSSSEDGEAVLRTSHSPSWAYYTDSTEKRWYISSSRSFEEEVDIYSLGYMVDNQAAWWTVAKSAATGSVSMGTLTTKHGLDRDTATTFRDVGRDVWVTDKLILDDRRLIQGTTVPVKWWFFKAANGYWYILVDPRYDSGGEPIVRRFKSKNNTYDWPEVRLPGTRTIFEWQGAYPRARFSPIPGYADETIGKAVDRDGYYGSQCVDLMHDYLDVALGIPFRSTDMAGNAYAIFVNAPISATYRSQKYNLVTFEKITRGSVNTIPLPGDIVFWRKPDPGHVAIVVDADASKIISIDQNWKDSDGEKGSPTAKITHPNNSDVAGWLRPMW